MRLVRNGLPTFRRLRLTIAVEANLLLALLSGVPPSRHRVFLPCLLSFPFCSASEARCSSNRPSATVTSRLSNRRWSAPPLSPPTNRIACRLGSKAKAMRQTPLFQPKRSFHIGVPRAVQAIHGRPRICIQRHVALKVTMLPAGPVEPARVRKDGRSCSATGVRRLERNPELLNYAVRATSPGFSVGDGIEVDAFGAGLFAVYQQFIEERIGSSMEPRTPM